MDKYKKEIEHYGMLYDYNDSEDYLRQNPHLACDDTANYLALWCINLEVQEVLISNSVWLIAEALSRASWICKLNPCYNCTNVSASFSSSFDFLFVFQILS